MDIQYLLWLQEFRHATQDVWTGFMDGVSLVSVSYLIFLPAFLYWCWDKKRGLFTLASLYLCMAVTAVLKLTACVYRPWIKDPRIIPATKSLPHSYSFPSGHTAMGTPMYVGSATVFWQKKSTKILALLCVALALLTGFSRNYLGVHTPQDVGVGFLVSLACLVFVWKAGNYLQQHPEKENTWLLITALLCVGAFVFIYYKPYPLDYVDGKLLVNPHKMMKDAFEDIGALLAFCGARYVEKTWIRFRATGLTVKGIFASLLGLLPLWGLLTYAEPPLKHLLGKNLGKFTWSACLVFYIIALYPWVLKKFFPPKKLQ